jgi:competence ComEA-like helix-hairpin-helix protein
MRLTGGLFLIIALTLAACARRDDIARNANRPLQGQSTTSDNLRAQSTNGCVNLNTATVEQLMPLPGIGEVMSRKIIAHREQYGPFRRPEDLIIIEGFSEQKYRRIEKLVCVN